MNFFRKISPKIFGDSVILLLFAAFALKRLTTGVADPDLWGYLAFGRHFWASTQFPYQDIFSYTPTLNPFVYHEWLTGVLFYPIYYYLGDAGLQTVKYFLALTTVWLIYRMARQRGADHFGTMVVLIIIQGFLSSGYSPVRAQVFTWLFFALTLFLLEKARKEKNFKILWYLIPLQVFWCNLHGGFLAGLGLLALYGIGETLNGRQGRPYFFIFGIACLATLLNPYGLAYWRYMASAVSMPRPEITEWISVLGALQKGIFANEIFYLACVVSIALVLFLYAPEKDFTPVLIIGLTLYLGLKHLRHTVFFLVVMGAYLPLPVSILLRRIGFDGRMVSMGSRLGWRIPTVFMVIFLLYQSVHIYKQHPFSLKIPPQLFPQAQSEIYYPVGAVNYIKEKNLRGNLLGEFNWGEYLIWNLYPQCRVSLDGRYETVYPPEVCRDYFDFINGQKSWRKFLEKYPPDIILVQARSMIESLLKKEPNWKQAYADPGCTLFVKGSGNYVSCPGRHNEDGKIVSPNTECLTPNGIFVLTGSGHVF
jgi:hypothetical protein